MTVLYITDDTTLTIPTIKMVCDCGWVEKAFSGPRGVSRAEAHIRKLHTYGLIVQNGVTRKIF